MATSTATVAATARAAVLHDHAAMPSVAAPARSAALDDPAPPARPRLAATAAGAPVPSRSPIDGVASRLAPASVVLANAPKVQAKSDEEVSTTTASGAEGTDSSRPVPDVVCALCLDSVKDPITTPCGHTFCSGRAGECEGLRRMAELSAHSAKCPQCRADIFSLLVERFPEQIQTAQAGPCVHCGGYHDDYDSGDEYEEDERVSAQRRYDQFLQPPSPASGAVGDHMWQLLHSGQSGRLNGRLLEGAFRIHVHAAPGDQFVWLPTRLLTSWQTSESAEARESQVSPVWLHARNPTLWFGVVNLASRLHERFHPVHGCWRAELRPGGAFYTAALQQIQRQSGGSTQVLVEPEVYAFTYEAIMHEELPVPCNVTSWPRSDGISQMYFAYDLRGDCLAFSHSDRPHRPLYNGQGYQPFFEHSYGQVPDSRAAGPFWMAGS